MTCLLVSVLATHRRKRCLILRELDFFLSRTVHQIAFIQNAVSRDGKTGVALICRSEVFQP